MASRPQLPELDWESMTRRGDPRHVPRGFPGRVSLACSFQKEESVLLDMLFALEPNARVFALDTHVLFPETYAVWREVERRYGTKVEVYEGPSLGRQAAAHGEELWERNPTSAARSARSSRSAARSATSTPGSPASAATSRRPARTRRRSAGTRTTSSGRRTRSPTGSDERCWDYIRERDLPYNELHDQRLRVDRLHALHAARRRPRGPLGRARQDRVRAPHVASADVASREEQHERAQASSSGSPASRPPASRRSPASSRAELEARGLLVDRLDGDVVRDAPPKGLGFSKEDRDTNIARIGWVASRLARAGAAVVVSAISPYEEARQQARALTEEHAHVRRGLRRDLARGVRAPRPEGPLREGARRRDRRVHRRLRPVRGAVEPGAADRDRGPHAGGVGRSSCSRGSRSSACSSEVAA